MGQDSNITPGKRKIHSKHKFEKGRGLDYFNLSDYKKIKRLHTKLNDDNIIPLTHMSSPSSISPSTSSRTLKNSYTQKMVSGSSSNTQEKSRRKRILKKNSNGEKSESVPPQSTRSYNHRRSDSEKLNENVNASKNQSQSDFSGQSHLQSPHNLLISNKKASGIHELPKFQRLDSSEAILNTQVLQKQIDDYMQKTDFKRHPLLSNPHHRQTLRQAMELVFTRKNILFCIDVEAWEVNPKIVTEIGISIYDPREQSFVLIPTITQIHIIIKENLYKKNGRYVPEHSKNFNGGTTYVMGQNEAVSFTQSLVDYYFFRPKSNASTCLVGHDVKGDVKWLKNLGINFPDKPNILDTQTVFSASHGQKGNSLKNALRAANLPHAFLHNAGNDAYYTLFLAMCLCDPATRRINRLDQVIIDPETLESPLQSPEQFQYQSPGQLQGQSPSSQNPRRKTKLGPNVSELVEIRSAQEMLETLFLEED